MTPHGSYSTYVNHKCRCDECRAANTAAHRQFTANRKAKLPEMSVPHGRYTTYTNWGCRCEECRAANARYSRKRYQRASA